MMSRSALSPTVTIAVDVTPLLPGGGNGGAKWFVQALLTEMARQRPQWRWVLLTSAVNDQALAVLYPGMDRLQVADDRLAHRAPPRVSSLLRDGHVDLLYCPFTAPFYDSPSVPTVATVYDLQFAEYPQFFDVFELAARRRHFLRAVAVCNRLICISDYVRAHVIRLTGLDERQVKRVHISLPDRLPAPNPGIFAELLARFGVAAGRYLIYPANAWPHKNHEMLLTAAGIYFTRHPVSDLAIVCTGVSDDDRSRRLRMACAQMGIAARVIWAGFLGEDELSCMLHGAKALIFPSLFEGFGMPLLEAMNAGIPVLCSNMTSLPEIAGDAALLFDPRRPDEIVRAIETIEADPAVGDRLVVAGQARARTFGSATTMASAYLEIFATVMAEGQRLDQRIHRRLAWARLVCGSLYARLAPARVLLARRFPLLRQAINRLRATYGATS